MVGLGTMLLDFIWPTKSDDAFEISFSVMTRVRNEKTESHVFGLWTTVYILWNFEFRLKSRLFWILDPREWNSNQNSSESEPQIIDLQKLFKIIPNSNRFPRNIMSEIQFWTFACAYQWVDKKLSNSEFLTVKKFEFVPWYFWSKYLQEYFQNHSCHPKESNRFWYLVWGHIEPDRVEEHREGWLVH